MTPTENETAHAVGSDRPGSDPDLDLFDYAPFAQTLAKGIASTPSPEGLVLSLQGKWGLGKTTALNYVAHYLEETGAAVEVVRFNPWWFRGPDVLAHALISTITDLIGDQETRADWRSRGEFLARAASTLPYVSGAATEIADRLAEPKEVEEAKRKLADELRTREKRILVIVDDIDRLQPKEMSQLFGVIKALIDFPNTIYLLAYDSGVVTRALRNEFAEFGDTYLDKIVQVVFDLPEPTPHALGNMFLEHVRAVLPDTATDSERARWEIVLGHGIMPLLSTPRDVVRLSNSIRVTLPAVADEVSFVDFIALEALRMFVPELYLLIRDRGGRFRKPVEQDEQTRRVFGEPDEETFHGSWIASLENRADPAVAMVRTMFPVIRNDLEGGHWMMPSVERVERSARGISDEQLHSVYFRHVLAPDAFASGEIAEFVQKLEQPESLVELLLAERARDTSVHRRVFRILEELRLRGPELGTQCVEPGVKGLLEVGDRLWNRDDADFFTSNETGVVQLVGTLLAKLPEADRLEVLRDAFAECTSIAVPFLITRRLGGSLGADESASVTSLDADQRRFSGQLLSVAEVRELELLCSSVAQKAIEDRTLWTCPAPNLVLAKWRAWAGDDVVAPLVRTHTISPDSAITLLLGNTESRDMQEPLVDIAALDRAVADPEALRRALADVGFPENPYRESARLQYLESPLTADIEPPADPASE